MNTEISDLMMRIRDFQGDSTDYLVLVTLLDMLISQDKTS
jgi:hypothetical protein